MKSKILIVTPIVTDSRGQIESVKNFARPDMVLEYCSISQGPTSLESQFDDALCVPAVLEKVITAERNGFSAVVVACMADPGLAACREAVSIPVIGTAEAAMHVAAMLGRRFGYIGMLDCFRDATFDLAKTYGLSESMSGYVAVDRRVLDIEGNELEISESLAAAAIKLVIEFRVGALVLGCTGLVNCADVMREALVAEGLNVQVINPLPLCIHLADALVKAGLSHSKLAYPQPNKKKFPGYSFFNSHAY